MRDSSKPDTQNTAAAWACRWLRAAAECQQLETFWQQVIATIGHTFPKAEAILVHSTGGQWEPLTSELFDHRAMASLLATSADDERVIVIPPHAAIPLRVRELPGLLACFRFRDESLLADEDSARRVEQLLTAVQTELAAAVGTVWQRQQTLERTRWLEELLRSVDKWNTARESDERVYLMERSAVQLLSCQYAFLLFATGSDPRSRFVRRGRAEHQDGVHELRTWQLEVRQGRVFRTAAADAADLAAADLTIDGERPRTFMAVPLLGPRNDVVACLLCVNKRAGEFTTQDGEKAIELVRHMATAVHLQPTDLPLGERSPVSAALGNGPTRLIGESEAIRELRGTVKRVAQTELPVLVMGENGTGKEVVCRLIHAGSARADRPFLAVNCAAISETLLESELFGHEKGAFTDASRTRAGKFELAHGGTLFLDEIGDMTLSGQVKLLRVLEEKLITRVGGSEPIEADVRVLAATNKDLAQLVRDRHFREDLFFRLNVVTLRVPPLRSRQRDISVLAKHFLDEFSHRVERPAPTLSADAVRRLQQYQWPGNVRELRNLMERIVFLTTEETVDEAVLMSVLPDSPTQPVGSMELPLTEATRQFQIDYISHHIAAARGNMSEAARRLGLHRSNLYRKLSQLGMADPS